MADNGQQKREHGRCDKLRRSKCPSLASRHRHIGLGMTQEPLTRSKVDLSALVTFCDFDPR